MNAVREKEKGIWVPLEILRNEELSPNEKFILGGIENIVRDGDECYIANSKLARTLQLSEKRVGSIMTSLVKKNYIEIKIEYERDVGRISKRGIFLTEKFKKTMKVALLKCEEEDEESSKIGVLENEVVVNKFNENALLENEKYIYNINDSLSFKDGLLKDGSLKEELKNKSTSNVFINTREEVKKTTDVGLGIFRILAKPEYARLEKYTKRNIIKYCSHVTEEDFAKSFEKITKLEEQGLIKDFGAAIYLDIQGKWRVFENPVKSKPIIEKESLDEKIRWFKTCFRGVNVEEYEEYLERIPFYILEQNRKKLGRMSVYEFKQEIKKLLK